MKISFFLPLSIVLNEIAKTFILSYKFTPYQNLITGVLLFIFSFSFISYKIRILFACLYAFSFVIDTFLMPIPPYLLLLANSFILFNSIKKKDSLILYFVISIINFFFVFKQLHSLYWFALVLMNIMVLFMFSNKQSFSPILLCNIFALLLPFINWEYSFIIFGITLITIYILHAKKIDYFYEYRIFIFAISFPLFFLKFNMYLSLSLFVICTVLLVLVLKHIKSIYELFAELVYEKAYVIAEKFISLTFLSFSQIIKSIKIRPDYFSISEKIIAVINKINTDALIVIIIFVLFCFFIFKLTYSMKGSL